MDTVGRTSANGATGHVGNNNVARRGVNDVEHTALAYAHAQRLAGSNLRRLDGAPFRVIGNVENLSPLAQNINRNHI